MKVLNYNEAVEVVFQGTNLMAGAGIHPMHLHGYSFYVVGIGLGNFDNETDPKGFNLVDPPEVNTFEVPKNGWLALRFIANNPGKFFLYLVTTITVEGNTYITDVGGRERKRIRYKKKWELC